ncbi:4-alpha-glucanotransferase [Pseudoalteromonas sp. GB56]
MIKSKRWQWPLSQGVISGDYVINEQRYLRLQFAIDFNELPVGIYDARVKLGTHATHTQLWWVPKHAYDVPFTDKKHLGISCGLYTIASEQGVGIGDFQDLALMLQTAAKDGIDYVLLNPLHLLDTDDTAAVSPYSPVSRLLLHPLYISVLLSDDCDDDLKERHCQAHAQYRDANYGHWLNYDAVYALKWPLLQQLYRNFCDCASAQRREQFDHFKFQHATALASLPTGSGDFEQYLQWQAWQQRKYCQETALRCGMKIGLINDLAVGVTRSSGEFENFAPQFTEGAEIGAPPDPFARHGQNWGMPALHPKRIAHKQFAYFRSLLGANMKDVGALRIDHVMALRRVWWCLSENQGCYVYYPFDHLLSAVKILSHQHQCAIIGEDLGVVPHEVRDALAQSHIASNTVYYFCQDHDAFIEPDQLRQLTLLMISNHDLPPFASWWLGGDVDQGLALNLLTQAQVTQLKDERIVVQQRLITFLNKHGFDVNLQTRSDVIYEALCCVLAQSPCVLFTLQLDDLDGQQVALNVPGTDKEYPNWRRQLSQHAKRIISGHSELLKELNRHRNG